MSDTCKPPAGIVTALALVSTFIDKKSPGSKVTSALSVSVPPLALVSCVAIAVVALFFSSVTSMVSVPPGNVVVSADILTIVQRPDTGSRASLYRDNWSPVEGCIHVDVLPAIEAWLAIKILVPSFVVSPHADSTE